MSENNKVHLNIQSRQFIGFKSVLILAKIKNLDYGVFVFGAFVSWGFCLWGFCLLGVLSLGFLSMGLLSVGLLYLGLLSAPPIGDIATAVINDYIHRCLILYRRIPLT